MLSNAFPFSRKLGKIELSTGQLQLEKRSNLVNIREVVNNEIRG